MQKTINKIAVLYYIKKAGVLKSQYRLVLHSKILVSIKKKSI